MKKLLCFGFGYSARFIARELIDKDWQIYGTTRQTDNFSKIELCGAQPILYDGVNKTKDLLMVLKEVDALLISIAPDSDGDPVLNNLKAYIQPSVEWIGYLSTVGVYGNWDGEWVDEKSSLRPVSERSLYRVAAENKWLELHHTQSLPIHIFRLSGIYGPGRNPLVKLKNGTSRRIIKPDQVFNRIHVEDISQVVIASMQNKAPGRIYNVTDDEPAPPQDVICYGAELLDLSPPPEIDFETANLTPMARSFYGENKRVKNELIKAELGITLKYPTYREGLGHLAAEIT